MKTMQQCSVHHHSNMYIVLAANSLCACMCYISSAHPECKANAPSGPSRAATCCEANLQTALAATVYKRGAELTKFTRCTTSAWHCAAAGR